MPIKTLRKKYQEQGYLWLKRFFDREEVLAIRRQFFESLAATGLLAANSAPVDGIYSGNMVGNEAYAQSCTEAARSPEYIAFCTSVRIWRFYKEFLDGEIYLHQRKLIRFLTPHERNCTGGHYDLIYLRAGTTGAWPVA